MNPILKQTLTDEDVVNAYNNRYQQKISPLKAVLHQELNASLNHYLFEQKITRKDNLKILQKI